VVYLRNVDTLFNSAVGQFQFSYTASPAAQLAKWMLSCENWSSVATTFDESQPVSLRVRFSPVLGAAPVPYLIAYDNDGGTPALPSALNVGAYRTAKMLDTSAEAELMYVIPPPPKGQWYDVGAAVSEFKADMVVATACAPTLLPYTTPYVALYYELAVRFRGVR